MNGKTTLNRRWKYRNSKGGTKWQEKTSLTIFWRNKQMIEIDELKKDVNRKYSRGNYIFIIFVIVSFLILLQRKSKDHKRLNNGKRK